LNVSPSNDAASNHVTGISDYLSVSDLINNISTVIHSTSLQNLWIQGELTNYTYSMNNNHFFSLSDGVNSIDCIAFSNSFEKLDESIQSGNTVLAHGSIDVYKKKGRLQLVVDFIFFGETGPQHADFLRLKKKFEEEGLFSIERKRLLPKYPKSIGIVTSEHGAVINDLLTILKRRWPIAKIYISPSSVQGQQAPTEIIHALETMNQKKPDVTVIARGGGSNDDFDAFNNEQVVRAIYKSNFPIVTALGHQENWTLSDLVSDLQAATPSEAAEVITPNIQEVTFKASSSFQSIQDAVYFRIKQVKKTIAIIVKGMAHNVFDTGKIRMSANNILESCLNDIEQQSQNKTMQVNALKEVITALSPQKVLNRGYSIITNHDEKILTKTSELEKEEKFTITLSDGSVQAEIGGKDD
tara:strand:- start:1073 stop:2308 length:1236 start_codon:yes stop_codon:yes gene_type:complete